MSNENKLIPELRFPKFENDGEWEINEFGELINILADYTANGSFASLKENVTYYSSEEYAVLVRTTDLDKKTFTPARFTDKRGYEFLSKTSLFGNEIVMANVGSIGKVFRVPYYNKKMTLAPNTYVLKFNDFVEEDFIYQLMLRSEFEKQLLSMVGSSTLMAINKSNLRSIKVAVPKKIEQQKIASCLSSLDEIIATHSQKLDLLKDHKKGLMQNLFPQEGEKVPKYRFKEFENDGEWVEKKLNYYLELLTDFEANGSFADVKANVNVFDEPNYAWYVRATDLEKKSNSDSIKYVDEHSYDFLNKTKLLGGELLITKRGEIGKVYMYKPFKELPATVAPNLYLLKLNEKAEPKFFYFHFTNTIGNQSLKRLNASSTIGALYKDDVKNISVFVPSLKEQQKIASCLSSLDALITAQTERIEQLKLHKKGLMQGLFPKIEI
jgi:type I restriction enzyme S subunit